MPTHVPPRIYRRVPFETAVRIEFDRFSGFVEQYSANLSLGGLFVRTATPPPVGTVVPIEFRLGDGFELIRGTGKVVWVRSDAEAGPERPAGMGIRFVELTAGSRELIFKMVERRVKDGGRPFDLEEGEETLPEAPPRDEGTLTAPPWELPGPPARDGETAAAPPARDRSPRGGGPQPGAAARRPAPGAEPFAPAHRDEAAVSTEPPAAAAPRPAPGTPPSAPAHRDEAALTAERPAAFAARPAPAAAAPPAPPLPFAAPTGDRSGPTPGSPATAPADREPVAAVAAPSPERPPVARNAGSTLAGPETDEEFAAPLGADAAARAAAPVEEPPPSPPSGADERPGAVSGPGGEVAAGTPARETDTGGDRDRAAAGDAFFAAGATDALQDASRESAEGGDRRAWTDPEEGPALPEDGEFSSLAWRDPEPTGEPSPPAVVAAPDEEIGDPPPRRRHGRAAWLGGIAVALAVAAAAFLLLGRETTIRSPAPPAAETPRAAAPSGEADGPPLAATTVPADPAAAPSSVPAAERRQEAATPDPAPAPAAGGPPALARITWDERGGRTEFTLQGTRPIGPGDFDHFTMGGDHPRLVVRLFGIAEPFRGGPLEVRGPRVARVRVGLHPASGPGGRSSLHVVFDLTGAGVTAGGISASDGRLHVGFEGD